MKLPLRLGTSGTLHDADGHIVSRFGSNRQTNEFIMRACNSHYELLQVLEEITSGMENIAVMLPEVVRSMPDLEWMPKKARAALAKAQPSTEKEI